MCYYCVPQLLQQFLVPHCDKVQTEWKLLKSSIQGLTLIWRLFMVQLSSKVMSACIRNVCEMHLKHVQDTSESHNKMRPECICTSAKTRNRAAARCTWVPRPFLPDTLWNKCRTRLKRVRDASEMRVNVTLELSRTVTSVAISVR